MTELYRMEVTDECMIYVWKGEPADLKKQRPMFPWYQHCSAVAALKHSHNDLFKQRMNIIKKWFNSKDSSYATIYKHYHEVEGRW